VARLVPLRACYSIAEAVCLRSMLAAYGVWTSADTIWHAQIDWYALVALHGIDLHVLPDDEETARALLVPVEDYIDDLETEPEALFRPPSLNLFLAIAVFYFFDLIPFWVRRRYFKSEEAT
jgi:hypothetical protein